MTNTVICLVTNLFRIIIIVKYLNYFLDNVDVDWKSLTIVGAGYYLINTGGYLLFHYPVVNVITNLGGIMALALCFTKQPKKICFIVGTIYVMNMICDTIAVFSFTEYKVGEEFDQLCTIVTVLLFFLCELLVEKTVHIVRKQNDTENNALLVIPLVSLGLLFSLSLYDQTRKDFYIRISMGLLLINFAVLFLYNSLLKSQESKWENELMKQKTKEYKNQLQIMKDRTEEIRNMKHDLKNHILELEILSKQGNNQSMINYLGNMKQTLCPEIEIVDTGNDDVDSLLNYWLMKARAELAQVNTKILVPMELLHAFDVCIVLGNLLENAIEAAIQTSEKTMDLEIEYRKGMFWVKIQNSCAVVLTNKNGKLISTKADKEHHGKGLQSVKRTVDKYDGKMNVMYDNNIFGVEIIMYM